MAKLSRIRREINEMADDLHAIGLLDAETHAKITKRSPTKEDDRAVAVLSGVEAPAIRRNARRPLPRPPAASG